MKHLANDSWDVCRQALAEANGGISVLKQQQRKARPAVRGKHNMMLSMQSGFD